jgi:hypothetical protein
MGEDMVGVPPVHDLPATDMTAPVGLCQNSRSLGFRKSAACHRGAASSCLSLLSALLEPSKALGEVHTFLGVLVRPYVITSCSEHPDLC